jgi:hypothetical protein
MIILYFFFQLGVVEYPARLTKQKRNRLLPPPRQQPLFAQPRQASLITT